MFQCSATSLGYAASVGCGKPEGTVGSGFKTVGKSDDWRKGIDKQACGTTTAVSHVIKIPDPRKNYICTHSCSAGCHLEIIEIGSTPGGQCHVTSTYEWSGPLP